MSTSLRLHLACLAALTATAGLAFGLAPPAATRAPEPTYRISGPFSHDNLTIFFLHGEDQIKGKKFLTLDEALKAKKVIVHETKNVNQLSIENVSSDEVFVQAGDIVKGGQQDRTIAIDLIVPPKSGKLPVASFCVEQGRWSKRGGEDEKAFGRSTANLVGNSLKMAARYQHKDKDIRRGSQRQVWNNVAVAQAQLARALKAEVKSGVSQSSLQLTLENKKLLEAVNTYFKKLEKSLDRQRDVIGYAVAINGTVTSADVYANADLFRKLWPKLLRCSAIEAVAGKKPAGKVQAVKAEAVKAFLADPSKGEQTQKETLRNLLELQKETEKNILFETCDKDKKKVIRRSYLKK
jgi:hypothetical protein